MKINMFLIASLMVASSGCSQQKSPSEVYDEYNSKVIEGIGYQEDLAYFTQRKQREAEAKLQQYMKQMKKSREQVIATYLEFSREAAKCKKIDLVSETLENDTAILEYSQQDICGNASTGPEKQIVHMKMEQRWKIDSIEINL
ncbi:hypothetical protein [Aliikangiella sp. G2MR2-5]|uniref:hypothetical protein n=1 Tax=Aliikangiella sp. G2MR2-5 TaxID=2788943 RepID=UPI0018AA0521|nr:hypothetical protein [Aliikangiella sp. G2MR2-5]